MSSMWRSSVRGKGLKPGCQGFGCCCSGDVVAGVAPSRHRTHTLPTGHRVEQWGSGFTMAAKSGTWRNGANRKSDFPAIERTHAWLTPTLSSDSSRVAATPKNKRPIQRHRRPMLQIESKTNKEGRTTYIAAPKARQWRKKRCGRDTEVRRRKAPQCRRRQGRRRPTTTAARRRTENPQEQQRSHRPASSNGNHNGTVHTPRPRPTRRKTQSKSRAKSAIGASIDCEALKIREQSELEDSR